ncbi:MAG: UDP-N-acetylglucosamine 2-epimerase (non-hydrolyzing), partial [Flavobacteriales bacterium]|nr:UDP-N-acetylglucosamine 2-epimerase (non-hydrolyzing) [Flavobacteriales bacterium]
MDKLLIVVGTRPNFIKVTQFRKHCQAAGIDLTIVHTGQHYDKKMSGVFFEQFGLTPDIFLNIGPGSPSQQIADIMVGLEKVLLDVEPDMVMVVGDVNSTMAAAITANKLQLPIAHLESGLRSGDRGMPEEINRIITDRITDHFFITEQSGWDHLIAEGQSESQMHFVGNTMIDTIVAFESEIEASEVLDTYKLGPSEYVLMTMHRPATVDHPEELEKLLSLMEMVTGRLKLVFPIHPRTVKNIEEFGMKSRLDAISGLVLTDPMDYFSFQKLIKYARFILTDSGGIQEESTFRQIPCLTLRPNTERPSTITLGTNELVTFDLEVLREKMNAIVDGT